jgi:hypothetical protein
MSTTPNDKQDGDPAVHSSDWFCCPEFRAAQQEGTDNEGYCAIISYDGQTWGFNSSVPPISFCPWCGKRLPQNH